MGTGLKGYVTLLNLRNGYIPLSSLGIGGPTGEGDRASVGGGGGGQEDRWGGGVWQHQEEGEDLEETPCMWYTGPGASTRRRGDAGGTLESASCPPFHLCHHHRHSSVWRSRSRRRSRRRRRRRRSRSRRQGRGISRRWAGVEEEAWDSHNLTGSPAQRGTTTAAVGILLPTVL